MNEGKSAGHAHARKKEVTALEEKHGSLPDLRIGDVVLVRHRRRLMRFFLRKATRSYWDHSALILFPKDPGRGHHSHILVEAIQHGLVSGWRRGTEVHKFEKYLERPDLYDVGVKRHPDLDPAMRERIRSFALMNVDSPYYHLWLFNFLLAWLLPPYGRLLERRQRYSCSALIQKAYYGAADWDEKSAMIFREKGDSPIELQELVTPGDIAESEVLEWIWNKR